MSCLLVSANSNLMATKPQLLNVFMNTNVIHFAPGILESLLFCLCTRTHIIYNIYRNLEYFPLQCDRVQFTQRSHDLLACEVLAFCTSEQDVCEKLSRDELIEHVHIVAF